MVKQWIGSYCDTKSSCRYPTTGKPDENFGLHGLWPNYNSGKYPQNCNSNSSLEISQKEWPTLACPSADGIKFWGHEWEKHGTCSSLDQHSYFQAALDLKAQSNLLQKLEDAGIVPGGYYNLTSIKQAIQQGIGYEPYIQCNKDAAGNLQVYQVYLCVDISASKFIECPVFPKGRKCNSTLEFPSLISSGSQLLAQL